MEGKKDGHRLFAEKAHESGGLKKKDYEKYSKGKYYVPLRGYDRKTAEDLFDYSSDMDTYFSHPMRSAGGRRSRSENPFAYIDQMAMSATKFANWNLLCLTRRGIVWPG